MTTNMDGFIETIPFSIVGTDAYSVVIRDDSPFDPKMAILETSKFSTIHFDGDDSYWVMSELGGFVEYFKRVAAPTSLR